MALSFLELIGWLPSLEEMREGTNLGGHCVGIRHTNPSACVGMSTGMSVGVFAWL